MNGHDLIIRHRTGEDTGLPLQCAACTCGWDARIWFANPLYVRDSHERHVHAVESGTTVPWMVAPRSVA